MMRRQARLALVLGIVGVIGCGSSEPVITSPAQLKPMTPEEVKKVKQADEKVNEEEGGSYGGKNSKPGGAGR
jgi:hypothetical protein